MKRQISLQQQAAGIVSDRATKEFQEENQNDKKNLDEGTNSDSSSATLRKTTSMFTSAPRNNDTSKIAMRSEEVQQAYVQYLSKQANAHRKKDNAGSPAEKSRANSANANAADVDPAQII